METIDIQNRCFVVRWVKCSKDDVINYQVKPLKKSIQFGIYKKLKTDIDAQPSAVHIAPDTKAMLDYTSRTLLKRNSSIYGSSTSSSSTNVSNRRRNSSPSIVSQSVESKKKERSSSNLSIADIQQQTQELPLKEKLAASGFKLVEWLGTISGNNVKQGTIEVKDNDYYYAFILDNTASKNAKKKILFNASVIKDTARPVMSPTSKKSSSTLFGRSRGNSAKTSSTKLVNGAQGLHDLNLPKNAGILSVGQGRYLQGYLMKKRRKRLQGFKKRFFTLDYRYGTLSYYLNDHNQTCRGEMVIHLSTVSANKKDRIIIIDSGMELWFLKAADAAAWQTWVDALQFCFEKDQPIASDIDADVEDTTLGSDAANIEGFSDRTINDSRVPSRPEFRNTSAFSSSRNEYTPLSDDVYNEFAGNLGIIQEWVEKCKLDSLNYVPARKEFILEGSKSVGGDHEKKGKMYLAGIQTPKEISSVDSLPEISEETPTSHQLYKRLSDLESIVDRFIKQSRVLLKDHRYISKQVKDSRQSIISTFSDNDEYFDAKDGIPQGVILLDDAEEEVGETGIMKDDSAVMIDDVEDDEYDSDMESRNQNLNGFTSTDSLVPNDRVLTTESTPTMLASKSDETPSYKQQLYPFPIGGQITRRKDILPSLTTPPSLLSFLRKNVGKDLSSITMPVTSNEPLSILQVISEAFEYSDLLSRKDMQPLTSVTLFAISALSIQRDKTRALRKPFNPLLGETFEYVHDKLGFRLIAEKVSHKPQIFAFNAEHQDWVCEYTMTPVQKFWGKSLELNNEGTIKLTMKSSGVVYKWVQPTTMVKNLIAGERYTEPVNEFEILGSDGSKAKITFQKTGIFGGRSESLTATITPPKSSKWKRQALQGKWSEFLEDSTTHKKLWTVGDLVKDSSKKYGFTVFTAQLNEITDIERDNLPPTDSRLRPDIKAYESGDIEKAEELKLKLEQLQRDRRLKGHDVKPRYFEKISNVEWKRIEGSACYWSKRERNDWSDVEKLW